MVILQMVWSGSDEIRAYFCGREKYGECSVDFFIRQHGE